MTLRVARGVTLVTGGLMILAALAAAGLLSGYVNVLNGAVRTAELRRTATADYARSAWRCNALPEEAERKKCLLQPNPPLREGG